MRAPRRSRRTVRGQRGQSSPRGRITSRRTAPGQPGNPLERRRRPSRPSRPTVSNRVTRDNRGGTRNVTGGRASVTATRNPTIEKRVKDSIADTKSKKDYEDRRKKLTKAPPRPEPSDKGKTGFTKKTPPKAPPPKVIKETKTGPTKKTKPKRKTKLAQPTPINPNPRNATATVIPMGRSGMTGRTLRPGRTRARRRAGR
jgi:hypothetical protein